MRKILILSASVFTVAVLSGCGSTIAELAKDPATVSVHQTITAPGWSVTTDYVRANSAGATGSAGPNGGAANMPLTAPQTTYGVAPVAVPATPNKAP